MQRMDTEERQEQIIDTAMQIINNSGYLAFTTRRLAKEIGISEPALYRHFKNKDEIIIGILGKMEDLWSTIGKQIDLTEKYIDKLDVLLSMHFHYIEENVNIVAVLFADEYIRWNETVKNYLIKIQSQRYLFLLGLLKEGIKKGSFRHFDPDILATIILGTVRSTILNWKYSPLSYSLTEQGEKVTQILIEMIKNNN